MKKLLAMLIIISAVVLTLNSCIMRIRFKFLGEASDIKSVSIAEFVYDVSSERYIEYHIRSIDDTEDFLKSIKRLKYKMAIINDLRHFPKNSMLSFKIAYNDEKYEFFDDSYHMTYTPEKGFDHRGDGKWFKDEQFYNLMFEYLRETQGHKFNYIRPRADIASVEILINHKDDKKTEEYKIEDADMFLDELEAVEYRYEFDWQVPNTVEIYDTPVIKIVYRDGSHEIFDHSRRLQSMYEGKHAEHSYIGTFNEAQFDALLTKYMQ